MFSDSKIVDKYRRGYTKTTHMLTGGVAKQITSDLKEVVLLTHWYELATDGTSNEHDKFLPVLVRYAEEDSGLIATSILDMPNINSGSTNAQQMYDVCNKVREAFSLEWYNCVTYSSDNTKSMIGQRNRLLQKIQSVQDDQKIFDVGCPHHLAHLCAGKGAKQLSVNVEDFVIDICHNFRCGAKLKNG